MNSEPVEKIAAATPTARVGFATHTLAEKVFPALTLLVSMAALLASLIMLVHNAIEPYTAPLLVIVSVVLMFLFVDVYRQHNKWDIKIILLALVAFIAIVILQFLPENITGWQINAIFHRSFFASLALVVTGLPGTSISLYYLWGATPQAEDISHYPLVLLPVLFAMAIYFGLIAELLIKGLSNLNWTILSKAYFDYNWPLKITVANDWPYWSTEHRMQAGLLNHLQGTLLLMLLTSLIALPIGAGAGIFLSEYASGVFEGIARFTITSLRAISTFILGLTALSLAQSMDNSPLIGIFRGTYFNGWDTFKSTGGSYLVASLVLAVLVVPIIVRSTEEGCRSLPPELREGSLALGASEQTTLFRITLPWAFPNIITALLLGCAEAGGSVAVLMFIAGRGAYGVGVTSQVTSLAYLIFDIWFGEKPFQGAMGPYQFTAGVLLLIITMGLGITALLLKRWLVKRHRGGV